VTPVGKLVAGGEQPRSHQKRDGSSTDALRSIVLDSGLPLGYTGCVV
jgi:hypothetical protein